MMMFIVALVVIYARFSSDLQSKSVSGGRGRRRYDLEHDTQAHDIPGGPPGRSQGLPCRKRKKSVSAGCTSTVFSFRAVS